MRQVSEPGCGWRGCLCPPVGRAAGRARLLPGRRRESWPPPRVLPDTAARSRFPGSAQVSGAPGETEPAPTPCPEVSRLGAAPPASGRGTWAPKALRPYPGAPASRDRTVPSATGVETPGTSLLRNARTGFLVPGLARIWGALGLVPRVSSAPSPPGLREGESQRDET